MITSTDRIYLRELNVDDGVHFFNINNDIECLKYTGDDPFESIEASKLFLKTYKKNTKISKWVDGPFA